MTISLKIKVKQIIPLRSMEANMRIEVGLHSVLT